MAKMLIWTWLGAANQIDEAIRSNLQKQELSGDAGGLADHYYRMFSDKVNTGTGPEGTDQKAWFDQHYDSVAAGDFRSLDQSLVAASGYKQPVKAAPKSSGNAGNGKASGNASTGKATVTHLGARAQRLGASSLPALPTLGGDLAALGGGTSTSSSTLPLAIGLTIAAVGGFYLFTRS